MVGDIQQAKVEMEQDEKKNFRYQYKTKQKLSKNIAIQVRTSARNASDGRTARSS